MMEVIGALSLPFLLLCLIVYTSVMGWLIFRREKTPDRIEAAAGRPSAPPLRRPRAGGSLGKR